ncbi:uncharacterized protein LOC121854285 isoform X2 [Homarus americanus]|nr:uncharacterized protein LOC121854285 isoform X2 [Homarus americanus]
MEMEPNVCYICHDKRRIADTDTSKIRIGNTPDAETLKETLIRALSLGYVEDNPNEPEQTKFSSGVCIVSLNSRCDGGLEAVGEKVVSDHVVICRRCESLLRDFEFHERTSAKIASEIRRFLTRQEINEKDYTDRNTAAGHKPQTAVRTSLTRNIDERKGIMAALRALRKSGVSGAKKRGRKAKKDINSSIETIETGDDDIAHDAGRVLEGEISGDEQRQQALVPARSSKRIKRRQEDGLVIRWGDAMYEAEHNSLEPETEADDFYEDDEMWSKREYYPRKRRGRKPGQHQLIRLVKPLDDKLDCPTLDHSVSRYQCPFCQRYYIPSNSRIHNCTSYKNQLRCQLCKIFFTSYIRLEKHLEVLHLKKKQLRCQKENCHFTCVSEPAFVLHKHFHFLTEQESDRNEDDTYLSENVTESDTESHTITHAMDPGAGEVTIMDDIQGIVTSPDIADQVSFLLDEKSFLSDGQPINITTDNKGTKNMKDQRRTLSVQGVVGEEHKEAGRKIKKNYQEDKTTHNKSESINESVKEVQVFQCPFCDIRFNAQKIFQDHIKEIHRLMMKSGSEVDAPPVNSKSDGRGRRENVRDSVIGKDIIGNFGIKKNFNITPEDLTYTVERLKGKISKS